METRERADSIPALSVVREDGHVEIRSPGVGLWCEAPQPGRFIGPRESIGRLEVLGVYHPLETPADAVGVVIEAHTAGRAKVAMGHGDLLLLLAPGEGHGTEVARAGDRPAAAKAGGLTFAAPMSGRFYARPSPDKPPLVEMGQEIEHGQTVGLLEVMKTFNRLVYEGADLPPRARVIAILPADGDDLSRGDPILELEAVGGSSSGPRARSHQTQ
jgi:acetyl-CoA carboxylase biotin carboxyl carrier protein